jgi:hypothetical protein
MDRFYTEQNIIRYRKLASEAITSAERTRLIALLAREMSRFTELHKAQARGRH